MKLLASIFFAVSVLASLPSEAMGEIYKTVLIEQAEEGNRDRQFELALRYEQGTSFIKQDKKEAKKWLRAAARNRHPEAQLFLGLAYHPEIPETYMPFSKMEKPDYQTAHEWLLMSGQQQGTLQKFANFFAGEMYLLGTGLADGQNFEEAFQLLRASITQDNVKFNISKAEFLLALMYRDGLGVKKNLKEYHYWLKEAANRPTNVFAARELFANYFEGSNGVSQDLEKAEFWVDRMYATELIVREPMLQTIKFQARVVGFFQPAFDYNMQDATRDIGIDLLSVYENDAPKDIQQAVRYYEYMGIGGVPNSSYHLAKLYFKGLFYEEKDKHVPNYHRAYAWALVSQKEIEQGVGDPKYLEEMKSMQENILRFFQDNPEKAVETQDRALSIIGRHKPLPRGTPKYLRRTF